VNVFKKKKKYFPRFVLDYTGALNDYTTVYNTEHSFTRSPHYDTDGLVLYKLEIVYLGLHIGLVLLLPSGYTVNGHTIVNTHVHSILLVRTYALLHLKKLW